MKSKFQSIIALFLAILGVVAWLPPVLVSADITNPVITIIGVPVGDADNDSGSIYDMCNDVNTKIHDKKMFLDYDRNEIPFLTYEYKKDGTARNDKYCNITVNMSQYNKLSNSEQQKVMQIALDTVYASNITRTNKNKIYNSLCDLDSVTSSLVRQLSDDVEADIGHAYKYFKPFSTPIGIIFGCVAVAMFVLLAFTLIIDLAYLTLPIVQYWLGKTSNNEKPKLVSLEAANAIREMESKVGQEYVNPLSIYFKSKVKQYVALAICILYLVGGKIFVLISSWIDYFSGFVK